MNAPSDSMAAPRLAKSVFTLVAVVSAMALYLTLTGWATFRGLQAMAPPLLVLLVVGLAHHLNKRNTPRLYYAWTAGLLLVTAACAWHVRDLMGRSGRYDQAVAWLQSGDYARVTETFDGKHQDDPRMLRCVGFAWEKRGDPETAEARYRASIALDPGDAASLHLLASFYERRQRFEDALGLWDRLNQRDGNNPDLHYHLALAQANTGHLPGATGNLTWILERVPDDHALAAPTRELLEAIQKELARN